MTTSNAAVIEQQLLLLINQARANAGLAPVTLSIQLNQAALGHSHYLAHSDLGISHTGPNNSSPGQRAKAAGYQYQTLAENVSAGFPTADEVFQDWMVSPGHRENILKPSVENLGVGYYYLSNDAGSHNYFHYWTIVLGDPIPGTAPSPQPPTPPAPVAIPAPTPPAPAPVTQPPPQQEPGVPAQPETPTVPETPQPEPTVPPAAPAQPVAPESPLPAPTTPTNPSVPEESPVETAPPTVDPAPVAETPQPIEPANPSTPESPDDSLPSAPEPVQGEDPPAVDPAPVTETPQPTEPAPVLELPLEQPVGNENEEGTEEKEPSVDTDAMGETIAGDMGDDQIVGSNGNDILRGDFNRRDPGDHIGGDDTISGLGGDDRIGGKGGDDKLFGDQGNDTIWGDDGDDLLYGGLGNDTLTGDNFSGGNGADTFVIAAGAGTDTITDFEIGTDLIGLTEGLTFEDLSLGQHDNVATISLDGAVLAQLNNVVAAGLTSEMFVAVRV